MPFNKHAIHAFRFLDYRFDESSATVFLRYAFDTEFFFTETIRFTGVVAPLDGNRRAALDQVLAYLHIAAGVSYYKAAVPAQLVFDGKAPDKAGAEFFERLYLHGLAEFAYRNQLDLRERIRFPHDDTGIPVPVLKLNSRTVIPLGGGKDSLVSVEILLGAGHKTTLISVGNPPVINAVAKTAGLPHIVIERRLAPLLFELNQQGAYNGHVPVSGLIAFILAAAAVLYDFDTVVMSNERSANSGNLSAGGLDVNHQYSKSLAFERDVQAVFSRILPGFRYFSLLRGLSELDIARLFSRHTAYHAVFSSCNANYKIRETASHRGNWCLNCPKCRFVFLCLAPFLDKPAMLQIFGTNLLDDPKQYEGFAALLGHQAHKPFECVGETEESAAAFYMLTQKPEWRDDTVVQQINTEVLKPLGDIPRHWLQTALKPSPEPLLPAPFQTILESQYKADGTT